VYEAIAWNSTTTLTICLVVVCLVTDRSLRSRTCGSDCLAHGSSSTVRPRESALPSCRGTWCTHIHSSCNGCSQDCNTRTHAHTHTMGILLKQETVSGSGISWTICKSAPCSRQITTPAPHNSVFYRPDALPATQPTASKHWRHKTPKTPVTITIINYNWLNDIN